MPIPEPRDSESEDEFIDRCMSNDMMNEEYPESDQRYAICISQWRDREKQEANMEKKSIQIELKRDKPGTFIARIATLNVIDADADITLPGAFPQDKTILVSAYQHGSWMGSLPVGKAVIQEVEDQVIAQGEFNLNTESGKEHYEAVKFSGDLQEWSYAFKPIEYEMGKQDGQDVRFLKKVDPFEISPVLKGAGVNAVTLGIKAEKKGTISYDSAHSGGTPKAAEDAEWDAGKEVKAADIDDLKVMCAWVDSADSENKGAYKLPHHRASGEHPVVWKGVAAAMGALLGARGGVDIPTADRKGVYNHLKKHYTEFDKDVPEFRADDGVTFADQAEIALVAIKDMAERSKSLADLRRKEGRILSDTNREKIKGLLQELTIVATDLKELLDSTEPDKDKALRLFLEFTRINTKIYGGTE